MIPSAPPPPLFWGPFQFLSPDPYWFHCVCVCAQLCLTLCDPMDCSPSGSSLHGIFQARVLEWVAISSSRGIFSTQGLNPCLLRLLHQQAGSLPLRLLGSIGSTTRLEITGRETASPQSLICLHSAPHSVVDNVYIKGAKCDSGFKRAGFRVGQEFLVRQPDNRRQCLKLYQVSGQSRDGTIRKKNCLRNWELAEASMYAMLSST